MKTMKWGGQCGIKRAMRSDRILLCLTAAAVFFLAQPVFAQESDRPGNTAEIQKLQRTIEEQQQQLDAQQKQMEAQQEQLKVQNITLQEIRQQMQALAGGQAATAPRIPSESETTPSQDTASRRTDTQTERRDKAQPLDDWKGSFGVEGLNTRLKIGGFVELDAIHDTDAIGSKGQFITSTIATRNETKTDGADGQTNFSVNPTRFYVETRTPINQHRLTTHLSMDFFGEAMEVQPDPRMRQAYGELSNILFGGDLLVGQAWATFSDLEAAPNVLDYQGPNSLFAVRQPLIRWSKGLSDDLKLMVAAETPDNHIIEGADSLTAWPEGVLSMVWNHGRGYMMGSIVARDLRASYDNGATETDFGWGGSLSGKVGVPFLAEKDFLTFSATYGEGIGSNFNDQPPDAVFNSTGSSLEAIPVFGWFVSYEHWWSSHFNSTVVYGSLDVDNLNTQSPDSLDKTQYASANLVWQPTERWLLGVETLWGKREDMDGENGSDFRTQFTSRIIY